MLVLSVKENEPVKLTCQCGCVGEVVLIEVRWHKIRLGFEFPLSVGIVRHDAINTEPAPRDEQ
jgi:sRNA-binding carbon storage regulator CsrA